LELGQAVEHYDTKRVTKDRKELDVSIAISPIRDANGHIVGASKVLRNVTERHDAERHRGLLMAELDHRVKNTLAAVQSIAMQTAKHAASIEAFREPFEKRLMSLAQTHSLLTQIHWESASLQQVVTAELSPYGVGGRPRFTISGEDIALTPKQALALGLGFHELATNAAKYGAFSVPEGHIDVSWAVATSEDGPMLELRWAESGGPRVEKPRARGFGSRLIERGLRTELDADVQLDFDPHGVRAVLRIPLRPEGA
jgi:two-component sensor histidine kinase